MNRISIAFAVNDRYIEHLLIAIYSLLRNNKKSYIDIYILEKDLTDTSRRKLKKFKDYFGNADISFVDMNDKMGMFKGISLIIDYISIETYFRFVLADLFPNLDKILYLDADILVQNNIDELWDTDISEYYVAGVEDAHILAGGYKEEINFSDTELYFNAGVLLLNLAEIRRDNIVKQLFSSIADRPQIRYQDQDILNITFKNRVKEIDLINNFMWPYQQECRDRYEDAVIIHYTGPTKPWSSYGLDNRPYWFYVYDQYVDDYAREINGVDDNRSERFGLFTYTTENVGDEIQSIAARQFLPRIDYHINRDDIDNLNYKDATNVKLIMNGWYTHHPENWPPLTKKITPLFIAMYFASKHSDRVKSAVLSPVSRAFLRTSGKVGVRDRTTEAFFKQNGIDSYFSGCLTLTIHKSPKIKKRDFVLAVDVSDDVLGVIKRQTKRRVITVSPEILTNAMSPTQRLEVAEWFLALIQSAHCVVTTRLHSALPSLALETPVLFMLKNGHRETDRFKGLIELTHSLSQDEYVNNPSIYDINKPKKNPGLYKKIRQDLVYRCCEFTGFINEGGYLSNDLPFQMDNLEFVQLFFDSLHSTYRYQNLGNILTGHSEYASTELEQCANHLKVVEQEYSRIEKENDEMKVAKRRYDKMVRIPRAIRNRVIRRKD